MLIPAKVASDSGPKSPPFGALLVRPDKAVFLEAMEDWIEHGARPLELSSRESADPAKDLIGVL
jgi:hypothetical protein